MVEKREHPLHKHQAKDHGGFPQYHEPDNLEEGVEVDHSHSHPHSHPQPMHARRELRTIESLLEYLQEESEDDVVDFSKASLHETSTTRPRHRRWNSRHSDVDALSSNSAQHHHRQPSLDALTILHRRAAAASMDTEDWQSMVRRMSVQNSTFSANSHCEEPKDGTGEEPTEHSNGDTHDGHKNVHGSLKVPWYCPPVQRQHWDDDQVLPHINWGDMFFDLFYIAAAYNLGRMLITSLHTQEWKRGILYFIGIFGPLYNTWENDVLYHSRYTLVDYFHRLVSVLRFMCVGMVVMNIKPITALQDPSSAETFCLVLGLLLESLLQMGRKLELYFFGQGDWIAIQNHTFRRLIYTHVPFSLTFLAATTVAGCSFFVLTNPADEHTTSAVPADEHAISAAPTHEDAVTTAPQHEESNGHFRFLSSSSPSNCSSHGKDGTACAEYQGVQWSYADIPLVLCASIYLINIVLVLCEKVYTIGKKRTYQEIKDNFVPSNVDYLIHRYGDWIMLLIGESVLSLLIVETSEVQEYYSIAVLGGITVIIIQTIIFESEPSHALGHALWRSMFTATLYSILIQVLSVGLIGLGASYKVMLTNVYLDQEEAATGTRRLSAAGPRISDVVVDSLYCGALALILLMLELMLGSHKRLTKTYEQLLRDIRTCNLKSLNWPFLAITLFKASLILYTITLPIWSHKYVEINLIGFLIVANMAMARILGWNYVDMDDKRGSSYRNLHEKVVDGEKAPAGNNLLS